MSDEKLRDLEDRWKQSGALGDEIRYLSERVRLGHTKYADLQAAALLGYPAAIEVAKTCVQGRSASPPPEGFILSRAFEARLSWGLRFGIDPGNDDARVIVNLQRAVNASAPEYSVRVSRAWVQSTRRSTFPRFVFAVEVAVKTGERAFNEGDAPPPALDIKDCTAIGFAHIWHERVCEACGVSQPPSAAQPVEPDGPPVPPGTIDYRTGRFAVNPVMTATVALHPEAVGRVSYIYVTPDGALEDEVADLVIRQQGRLDYAPLKPGSFRGTFEHANHYANIRDDGRGHLVWDRVGRITAVEDDLSP